jgi:hypothetical protein
MTCIRSNDVACGREEDRKASAAPVCTVKRSAVLAVASTFFFFLPLRACRLS